MRTLESSSGSSMRLPSLSSNRWSLSVMITLSPSPMPEASWRTLIFGTLSKAAFLLLELAGTAGAEEAAFMEPSLFRVRLTQSAAPPFPSSSARMSPNPLPVVSSLCASFAFLAACFCLGSSGTGVRPSTGATCSGSLEVPFVPLAASFSGLMPSFSRSLLLSSTLCEISPAPRLDMALPRLTHALGERPGGGFTKPRSSVSAHGSSN
mmetsp:Transcript_21167/g.59093  ORF Transcript_21167/g.59093 Transcript_21167/m.59093 type:complete len:208 (+) Transcript_21167:1583-2206(+)